MKRSVCLLTAAYAVYLILSETAVAVFVDLRGVLDGYGLALCESILVDIVLSECLQMD